MPYKQIVLSLNGLEDEKHVVDEAMRLASTLNANISIIHINDPLAGKPHMLMDSLPKVKEQDLRKLLGKFGYEQESQNIPVKIIESENYSDEIASATEQADLLIIGHHSKNLLTLFFEGATEEKVADLISCPMLVVPIKK